MSPKCVFICTTASPRHVQALSAQSAALMDLCVFTFMQWPSAGGKKTAVDTESIEGCSSASASTFADLTGSIDVDEVDDRSALEIVIDALYEKRCVCPEIWLGASLRCALELLFS